MIKTEKKVVTLIVMMVFGAALAFAQQSNTDIATFGRFQNDADYFFSSTDWKNVDLKGFFGYTRLGANIPAGQVDAGAAFKAGSLYVGAYYNGKVLGQTETANTTNVSLTNAAADKTETITVSESRKISPGATYGALVGIGAMGIKFTLEDNLAITNNSPVVVPPGHTYYSELSKGNVTPTVEVGGSFGPITKISLSVPIVYDVAALTDVNAGGNDTVVYTYTTQGTGTGATKLLNADGSYAQVDIGLSMEFGKLTLDNNLRFNIYGVNATGKDGKALSQPGVADVITTFDPFTTASTSRYVAVYDNRLFIEDEIVPSFDIAKGTSEDGKFAFAANLGIPVKFTFVNHAMNAKGEASNTFGAGIGTSFELADYYKQTNFDLGVAPNLKAAVQLKPAEVFSLQTGIGLDLFSWTMKNTTTTEVKAPSAGSKDALAGAYINGLVTGYYTNSGESNTTAFEFTYPDLSFALGFTVYFKKLATLDFVYINKFNPSVAGLVYKAVGEGLGSGDTSLVLTLKF
jgi:hypothetical protein